MNYIFKKDGEEEIIIEARNYKEALADLIFQKGEEESKDYIFKGN